MSAMLRAEHTRPDDADLEALLAGLAARAKIGVNALEVDVKAESASMP